MPQTHKIVMVGRTVKQSEIIGHSMHVFMMWQTLMQTFVWIAFARSMSNQPAELGHNMCRQE